MTRVFGELGFGEMGHNRTLAYPKERSRRICALQESDKTFGHFSSK